MPGTAPYWKAWFLYGGKQYGIVAWKYANKICYFLIKLN
jgi:hypothetical protein